MAIDISKIRSRLNTLQSTQRKSDQLWKPKPGKTQVRIVPYKYNKDNPFIELYFHYNVNNKTYISPISFGRPDPIAEFADKLKKMGDKEDWKAAKKMEPKLRTFAPVVVRGEESEGVRFWGFGKTVYQEILGYIADPDYGDITDPVSGRDITIDYKTAKEAGTQYPTTTIRVKPNETPLADENVEKFLEDQVEIGDLYQELSYDELKEVLERWLNPGDSVSSDNDSDSDDDDDDVPFEPDNKSEKDKKAVDDVASSFDELFND